MKREIWIDSFKGVLILLVVLGHSMQFFLGDKCYDNYWWNLIYSFHMPAFMAISGYLQFGKIAVDWGRLSENSQHPRGTCLDSLSPLVMN